MNLSLGAFVKLFNFYTNKLLVLLVDTGADISLIKSQNINEKNKINSNELKSLSGIGEGTVNSIGSTQLELRVENFAVVTHKFHVVHDDFPIPCDGIVGMDFLTEFNCNLDFMKNGEYLFFRQTNFQPFAIAIQNTCINDSLILPVRSQVIRKIKFQTQHKELLV